MGLRPGRCYRSKKDRAYTRLAVTVHDKNYIGAAPGLRVRQFNMGNPVKEFSHIVDLVVDEDVQLRDNSLESARMLVNRYMAKTAGKEAYFIKLRIYPYQVLRENKQAQGAHADRIQKGMSNCFGKAIGRAARVRPGQKILSILVDEIHIEFARKALKRAMSKICSTAHAVVGTDVKSIGTKPRKTKLEMLEKKEEEEAAAKAAAKPAAEAGKAEGAEAKPGAEGKPAAAEAGKAPAASDKGAAAKPAEAKKEAGKK